MKQETAVGTTLESNLAMETLTLILGNSCCSSLKYELIPMGALKTFFVIPPTRVYTIINANLSNNRGRAFVWSYKINSRGKESPGT